MVIWPTASGSNVAEKSFFNVPKVCSAITDWYYLCYG